MIIGSLRLAARQKWQRGYRPLWQLPFAPRQALVAVGDRVRVEYSAGLNAEWSNAHLVVRRSDGALLIWVGKSNLMPPPEVEVASAGLSCSFEDDCGRVERYGLRVAIGGERALLAYGESGVLGGYAVWHHGRASPVHAVCRPRRRRHHDRRVCGHGGRR